MTIEHRRANVTIELLQANVNELLGAIARLSEERDALKLQVEALTPKNAVSETKAN